MWGCAVESDAGAWWVVVVEEESSADGPAGVRGEGSEVLSFSSSKAEEMASR